MILKEGELEKIKEGKHPNYLWRPKPQIWKKKLWRKWNDKRKEKMPRLLWRH